MVRALVGLLALAALSACASWQAPWAVQEEACAMKVIEADAWINRMPGPGPKTGPTLQVLVRTDQPDTLFRLDPKEPPVTDGVLTLVLSEGDAGAMAGQAVWRSSLKSMPAKQLRVVCESGKELAFIEQITSVY